MKSDFAWWISRISRLRSTSRALGNRPRMMMIGKELLSGFWECPECRKMLDITSHPRSFPPPVSLLSHHFSCYTALSLPATKCFVVSCYDGLLRVISGILAKGIPGFRIVLCCFAHTTVWRCDVCVSLGSSFSIICHTNTRDDTMLSPLTQSLVLLCFVFVCFGLFVVSAFLFCFASCGRLRTGTIWTAYWSMLSFDTPKRERCKMLHNSFNWHKHCVTTWREPRRRRTEKNPITSFTELDCRSLSNLLFVSVSFSGCLFCLFFGCFVVFCFVCCSFLFLVAVFLRWDSDGCGLCTGPIPVHFCGPTPAGGYMHALIRQFIGSMQHATERVERPGESQEALDRKKMKSDFACAGLLCSNSRCWLLK